jgi:hypothetical protein
MPHSALTPNRTAVITGGASGIGFATAERLVATVPRSLRPPARISTFGPRRP